MSAQVYYRFWDSLGRTPSAILPARDFQSLSQHRRLAQYIQPEPNEALASSRWKLLGETMACLLLWKLLKGTSTASRSRAAYVLCGLWSGGSGFAAQGPGRALAPVHLMAPSLCPENPGPGLCFHLVAKPALPRVFGSLGLWPLIGCWFCHCTTASYSIIDCAQQTRTLCPVGRTALSPWV
jgi:hypothetical protein